ncbi:hypothetical protein TNCV_5038821 [Trichonephila clavipes]|nr:hypothetical protein TNCV_5038821 [Trichonephila clavipes]
MNLFLFWGTKENTRVLLIFGIILHPRINRKNPGGALEFDGDRNDQTAVSRLLSAHLKCMIFESGRKDFQTCPKCHLLLASPEHIPDCLGVRFERCPCQSTSRAGLF